MSSRIGWMDGWMDGSGQVGCGRVGSGVHFSSGWSIRIRKVDARTILSKRVRDARLSDLKDLPCLFQRARRHVLLFLSPLYSFPTIHNNRCHPYTDFGTLSHVHAPPAAYVSTAFRFRNFIHAVTWRSYHGKFCWSLAPWDRLMWSFRPITGCITKTYLLAETCLLTCLAVLTANVFEVIRSAASKTHLK